MPFQVYLRVSRRGGARAHVPELAGCSVAAENREAVLAKLPAAIAGYLAWLKLHGEPLPRDSATSTFVVVDEGTGEAALHPGDGAGLFAPDLVPLTDEDMARYLRLMGYTRQDLLALVKDLPDDILDWRPAPKEWTIRKVLRHAGNAEEWYVSRIVAPESLPAEWEHDEALPIFEFLDMERRTAVARLLPLSYEEKSGVFYPTRWTKHPEEPWTARKVFRRFLEHEREHTGQIEGILLETLRAQRAGRQGDKEA